MLIAFHRFESYTLRHILIAIALTSTCNAQDVSIIGHGFSKHLQNHQYNERNYGGGLRIDRSDIAIQAGVYRNSIHKNSVYAAVDWSPLKTNKYGCLEASAGLFAGGVIGYDWLITPVAGLQVGLKCKELFTRIRMTPDPFYNSKAVTAIEFGIVVKKF